MNLALPLPAPCLPPRWAKGGHRQTLIGAAFPAKTPKQPAGLREILLADGDRLVIETYERDSAKILLYGFHGLTGSSQSTYMIRLAEMAERNAWHIWLANHRGCGAGKGKAIHPYHCASASDLSAVIEQGRKAFPEALHVAIGFSLGGAALLNLISKPQSDWCLPDRAISVNAPLDLEDCSQLLMRGFNQIYDRFFVWGLNRALSESGKRIDARSLREFDERYTAKYAGFRDRTHYYETADVTQSIQNIAIPTILMTASDDPFVSASSYRNTRLSPQVFRHIEESGGHIGYLTDGGRFQLRPWLTDTLEMWLKNFAC